MSKIDRIHDLLSILHSRKYAVSVSQLTEILECSAPTVKRYIAQLRYEYGAPIRFDAKHRGYILDKSDDESIQFPGLWFNISELHSLLTIHELIDQLEPGLLKAELTPLRQRIENILASREIKTGELVKRVQFINIGMRLCCPLQFKLVAEAVMDRRKLKIGYHSRSTNRISSRTVSPQRMVYYRGNWYLAVFCHTRNGLRTLALDRIQQIQTTNQTAAEISDRELNSQFNKSFGIFSGDGAQTATLRFTADRARWVAEEKWHPDQKTQWLKDGSFEMTIPYSDHRELLLEIMKYGPDVEIIEPESLRTEIKNRLRQALKKY